MLTLEKIRAWAIEAEQKAVAEVHAFVDFIEGKSAIDDAVQLLEANGYTVTPPATEAPAAPPTSTTPPTVTPA